MCWILKRGGICGSRSRIAKIPVPSADGSGGVADALVVEGNGISLAGSAMGKGGRGFGQDGHHPGELVGAAVVGFYRQGDIKRACIGVVVGHTRGWPGKGYSGYCHHQNPRSIGLHNH